MPQQCGVVCLQKIAKLLQLLTHNRQTLGDPMFAVTSFVLCNFYTFPIMHVVEEINAREIFQLANVTKFPSLCTINAIIAFCCAYIATCPHVLQLNACDTARGQQIRPTYAHLITSLFH